MQSAQQKGNLVLLTKDTGAVSWMRAIQLANERGCRIPNLSEINAIRAFFSYGTNNPRPVSNRVFVSPLFIRPGKNEALSHRFESHQGGVTYRWVVPDFAEWSEFAAVLHMPGSSPHAPSITFSRSEDGIQKVVISIDLLSHYGYPSSSGRYMIEDGVLDFFQTMPHNAKGAMDFILSDRPYFGLFSVYISGEKMGKAYAVDPLLKSDLLVWEEINPG